MRAYSSNRPGRAQQAKILMVLLASTSFYVASVSPSFAGGGPENLFLLVNPESPESLEVANHYIHLRKIPPQNIFYVAFNPKALGTGCAMYRDKILLPTLETISKRGLAEQIDYVVYSSGYPWQVDFKEFFPGTFPKELRPRGSLSSTTYLLNFVKNNSREMIGLNTNFYCASPRNGVTVSQGFRSTNYYAPGGRLATRATGLSYMLSAALGVTYGRGNTSREIVSYLKRAVEADGSKPKGTIYYMKNKDVRSKTRDGMYDAAIRELLLTGVNAQLLEGTYPKNRIDVMGVTTGSARIDLIGSKSRLLPGSFCDNLTSTGGSFTIPTKPPGQTCVSEYLRMGAAGACGTVTEPYAIAQKFPRPTVHLHYARGCSLAESFYQSVQGPYQQILVGDPLCQPWADIPQVRLEGIAAGNFIKGVAKITPTIEAPYDKPIRHYQLFVNGAKKDQCQTGESFSLDTTEMPDGFHQLRVVATDATPIATQGRWMGQIIVKNGREAIQLAVDQQSLQADSAMLSVRVGSTTRKTVIVEHNGRRLVTVKDGNGSVLIETKKLGRGPVTLQAYTPGDNGIRARPVTFEIP
jgi:uncharacterized protein (TIGR03790 family)